MRLIKWLRGWPEACSYHGAESHRDPANFWSPVTLIYQKVFITFSFFLPARILHYIDLHFLTFKWQENQDVLLLKHLLLFLIHLFALLSAKTVLSGCLCCAHPPVTSCVSPVDYYACVLFVHVQYLTSALSPLLVLLCSYPTSYPFVSCVPLPVSPPPLYNP